MASFRKFVRQTINQADEAVGGDPLGSLETALNIATFGVFGVVKDMAYGPLKAAREQKRSVKDQERLSASAMAASQNQARLAEQAQNRANQKRPDLAAIMARVQSLSRGGVASTSLTGVGGVPRRNLRLGETSLLGE